MNGLQGQENNEAGRSLKLGASVSPRILSGRLALGTAESRGFSHGSASRRILVNGVAAALLMVAGGCSQQKPDSNVIETKLADGRVLHYTKQQLAEAQSWGFPKADYDTALNMGETHGAIIERMKEEYWNRKHPGTTPPPDITPPPEWKVNN
jgi:hypothetical protein